MAPWRGETLSDRSNISGTSGPTRIGLLHYGIDIGACLFVPKLSPFSARQGQVQYAVAMAVEWQQKAFKYGTSILGLDAITCLLAVLRLPHIEPTGNELSSIFLEVGHCA